MTPSSDPRGKKTPPQEPFVADFSDGPETGLYLALLELIDEGLLITGDELVLEANSAACRLLEREYRDIAGKPLADLFPSERAFLEARQRLLIQGEMRGSLQVSLPGGRQRSLRYIAAAQLRPGVHALIISPDIIADAYGEQAEHEDRLWPRLAAALEQPVIVVDEAGRVAAANAAALRTLKLRQDNLVGQPLDAVLEVEWPAPAAPPVAHLRHGTAGRDIRARVLPGPKPDWRVLVLPPVATPTSAAARRGPVSDLTAAVARAIELDQLEIHFQPLTDVRDGRIHGGEALLRWNHPDLGQIPFRHFVDIARECNLLARMGDWVLQTAMTEAIRWPAHHGRLPGLTVNVAMEQLMNGDLPERIRKALGDTGFPGNRLELDFDEQLLNEDSAQLATALSAVGKLGVGLAIDDFGRGPVSIPGLKRYPLSTIKLAPALVRDVGRREDCEAIVEAVAAMAEVLGLQVVARGVETRAQQTFLAALGCHLQQGPLFGQPLTAAAFARLLGRKPASRNQ